MDIKAIGKRVHDRRVELSMTQRELAEAVGTTREFITVLEAGYRMPSVMTLVAIAENLSISLDYIVLGTKNN